MIYFLSLALLMTCAHTFAGGPAQVQTIAVVNINVATLEKLATMDPPVTHLNLEGPGDAHQLKQICKAFADSKSLYAIAFNGVEFERLPSAILELKSLASISIKGNQTIDIHQTLETMDRMPQLRSLEIEVAALEDLPPALFELEQLERLVLHEYLLEGETKAAECIAVAIDMQSNGLFNRTVKAFVYVSNATWQNMQGQEDVAGLRKWEVCPPVVTRYNHVNPPLPEQTIAATTVKVRTDLGGVFRSQSSQSMWRVPAQAFVNANGGPVTGDVVVSFREFFGVGDFIASGIPMSFFKDSLAYVFESAGMVEVAAEANGAEVFLAPGKTIDVLLNASDSQDEYQVWNFDDASGKWLDVGNSTPANAAEVVNFTKVSQAVQMVFRMPAPAFNHVDTTSFNNRFQSPFYLNSTSVRNKQGVAYNAVPADKKYRKFSSRYGMRIRKVKTAKDGEIYFSFEGNRILHSELRFCRASCWRLDEAWSEHEFKTKWGRKHRYRDMRLVHDDGRLLLVLKENGELRSIAATPLQEWTYKGERTFTLLAWDSLRYDKYLNKRSKRFDRSNARKFNRQAKRFEADERARRTAVSKLMSAEERAMDWNDFLDYANAQQDAYRTQQLAASDSLTKAVYRVLQVTQLGLCNIDRLRAIPNQQLVSIEFLVDGQPTLVDHIYSKVVPLNTVYENGVLPNRIAQRVQIFGDQTGDIVVITAEGRIGKLERAVLLEAVASNKGVVALPVVLYPAHTDLSKIDL